MQTRGEGAGSVPPGQAPTPPPAGGPPTPRPGAGGRGGGQPAATTGTQSAWTSGIVANPTNSGSTGSLAFTHAYASTSCSLAARVTGTVSCASGLPPTAAATAGGVSATDTISNDGTLAAATI